MEEIRCTDPVRTIFAGDVNERSPMWHCEAYDWRKRGELLQGFIAQAELEVSNVKRNFPRLEGMMPYRNWKESTSM